MKFLKDKKNIKYIFLIMLILWTLFIFWQSSQNAEASSAESTWIVEFLRNILPEFIVRKMAHIIEFMVEGILVASTLYFFIDQVAFGGVVISIGFCIACLDETIQLFSFGRSSEVKDVWIDMFGYMIGVLLFKLISRKKNE